MSRISHYVFLAIMALGAIGITTSSTEYFDFARLPPFAVERLPVRHETLWLVALRVHVLCAILSLPACVALLTRFLLKRPAWHRRIGRIAGIVIAIGLVPTGFVLATEAKGGVWGMVGFMLSGTIVLVFLIKGIMAARAGHQAAHRRAMLHVVAQMSVAVSSRIMLLAMGVLGIYSTEGYLVALWVPVLGSAAIAAYLGHKEKGAHPGIAWVIFTDLSKRDRGLGLRSGSRLPS